MSFSLFLLLLVVFFFLTHKKKVLIEIDYFNDYSSSLKFDLLHTDTEILIAAIFYCCCCYCHCCCCTFLSLRRKSCFSLNYLIAFRFHNFNFRFISKNYVAKFSYLIDLLFILTNAAAAADFFTINFIFCSCPSNLKIDPFKKR